ncbi:hypothetical protein PM082_012353 [Marasmius tenuissimus]|nr:hypothetical protein PM082_012353 [Marasmius tenuissimus]
MVSAGTSIGLSPFILEGTSLTGNNCIHTKFDVTLQQIALTVHTVHCLCISLAIGRTLTHTSASLHTAKQTGLIEQLKIRLVAKDTPKFSENLLRRTQGDFILGFTIFLCASVGMAIDTIPLAYRVGILVAGTTVLHCRGCSTFRDIARSKYKTDVTMDDIDDLLPISFNRNSEGSSLDIGAPVGALSNVISGAQDDLSTGQRAA